MNEAEECSRLAYAWELEVPTHSRERVCISHLQLHNKLPPNCSVFRVKTWHTATSSLLGN